MFEDGRGPHELIKAKVVYADYSVDSIILDVYDTEGDKTSLTKCQKLKESIEKFTAGDPTVAELLQTRTQAGKIGSSNPNADVDSPVEVFTSDGESAEPLVARFAKAWAFATYVSVDLVPVRSSRLSLASRPLFAAQFIRRRKGSRMP